MIPEPCSWLGEPQTCQTHGKWARVCSQEWDRIQRVLDAAATLSVAEVQWLADCKRQGFDPVLEIQKLRDQATNVNPASEEEQA